MTTANRIKPKVAAFVVATFGLATLAGFTAGTARADTGNCTTDDNGVTYCNSSSSFTIDQSDTKIGRLKLTSSGVLQLKLEMNPRPPKTQIGTCRWVVGGENSFFNAQGHIVWISWAGKSAHICFTGRGPTGWQKVGPGISCWNFFKPPFMHKHLPVFTGRYRVVKNFSYTVNLSIKLTLHGSATATASCSTGGSSATGTATGSDTETITVKVSATSKSYVKAAQKAKNIAISSKQVSDMKAYVLAQAVDKMQLSASASCQSQSSPQVVLVLTNLTQPQDGPGGVFPDGETLSVCVTPEDTQPGDTIQLSFGGNLGSFSGSPITFTTTGTDTKCTTYVAPNDSGDVGKIETWTVTAPTSPRSEHFTGSFNR